MGNSKLHDEFKTELSLLLKKYRASIDIEDFGTGYSTDKKIVVDFDFIEDERNYSQLVLGTYID